MLDTKITILYVIVVAIILSPYVVFTWETRDTGGAVIIMTIYAILSILVIYTSWRSNQQTSATNM